jgi:hypothetical protein
MNVQRPATNVSEEREAKRRQPNSDERPILPKPSEILETSANRSMK